MFKSAIELTYLAASNLARLQMLHSGLSLGQGVVLDKAISGLQGDLGQSAVAVK